jgi:peroxiredoxin
MALLKNGDAFPALEVAAIEGSLPLSEFLKGSFGVVLIYRGAWCPFCNAQLAEFASEQVALHDLGVKVAAFSVDDLTTTVKLAAELKLGYWLGHSAGADRIASLTGAFTNTEPKYLQPTAFILTPEGNVMSAVYSTQAVGRLTAAEVLKFVAFMKSRSQA